MRKLIYVAFLAVLFNSCGAAKNVSKITATVIATQINLLDVVEDKVLVDIDPGAFETDTVDFYVPKTVPGTYSTDNYGQYVVDFKALDYDGNELVFTKTDANTWSIENGKQLDRVSYYVNDTYDTENTTDHTVFSPAGTNILKGENYMLNLHGFIGYFNDLKEVPYELTVRKPLDLISTTSLQLKTSSTEDPTVETFLANRYFELVDNPILYTKSKPKTFEVNDIAITLSVYSPSGAYTAADLSGAMETMMKAQKAFLGNIDGTKEYNILLYLSKMDEKDASGFGALEHHTSTVVVLPEAMPKDRLEQAMIDVVSHEFFHIVTPLNIHSKEVQYFDYNDPKMSKHLWMYEGTTEYFANLFQIQQGLLSEAEFYERIMGKISNARAYDDAMSFTVMSKNILKEPYKKNYANVYEKGALINMVLDIYLRELSQGEKGLLQLMKELSKKYGKNTPFEDDALIDEIVAMTYPEIGTFFNTYVIGDTPIDYSKFLAKVGLATIDKEKQTGYFLNGEVPFIDVDPSNGDAVFIRKGISLCSFYTDLGAKGGDVIKNINGIEINLEAIRPIIGQSFGWTPETEIKMTVVRDGEEILLEGKVGTPMLGVQTIVPLEGVSGGFSQLREAWIKG